MTEFLLLSLKMPLSDSQAVPKSLAEYGLQSHL
jgi:hypothetical protein